MTTQFPLIFPVRQHFEAPVCHDIETTVCQQLARLRLEQKVKPGDTIAITAGSRGISHIALILKSIVDFCRGLEAQPFLVPAMGSHGGGTAAGQRQILETYGITEAYCGCPIRSNMETVVIGEAAEGFPVYFDREAYHANHVIVCGRIKPHTNFAGDIQSGLMKMLMIGLGKQDGASLYHRAINVHGFPQIIRSVAPTVLAHTHILAGVAIVENAYDETAHIEAVLPDDFETREPQLLQLAKSWMPRLPFAQLDLLIIDEIGKNISGTGMDTNIVGRKHTERPDIQIQRILVRGLTNKTHGNAAGIGFADFCLSRVVQQMNRETTVLNCLTACDIEGAKIPIHFPTDRETIARAIQSIGTKPADEARVVWIRNTLDLSTCECSIALKDELDRMAHVEITGSARPFPFQADDMLPDLSDFQLATCQPN